MIEKDITRKVIEISHKPKIICGKVFPELNKLKGKTSISKKSLILI